MNLEDVRVDEYYDSKVMPYGMTCTHVPTGLRVMGNCKNESSVMTLKRTLLDQLAIFVGQEEGRTGKVTASREAAENDSLRATIAQMQQQMAQMMSMLGQQPAVAKKVVPVPVAAVKAKGWPKGKPRGKKAAKTIATPAGELTEAELIAQQMRPPTDVPVRLPQEHHSHGATVVKVSPELQAKGYRP
jgi:hypothetical protein